MQTIPKARRRYAMIKVIKLLAAAGGAGFNRGRYLVHFERLNVISSGLFVDRHRWA